MSWCEGGQRVKHLTPAMKGSIATARLSLDNASARLDVPVKDQDVLARRGHEQNTPVEVETDEHS